MRPRAIPFEVVPGRHRGPCRRSLRGNPAHPPAAQLLGRVPHRPRGPGEARLVGALGGLRPPEGDALRIHGGKEPAGDRPPPGGRRHGGLDSGRDSGVGDDRRPPPDPRDPGDDRRPRGPRQRQGARDAHHRRGRGVRGAALPGSRAPRAYPPHDEGRPGRQRIARARGARLPAGRGRRHRRRGGNPRRRGLVEAQRPHPRGLGRRAGLDAGAMGARPGLGRRARVRLRPLLHKRAGLGRDRAAR